LNRPFFCRAGQPRKGDVNSKTTQTQRLVNWLEHLGYVVEIKPLTA
jgi:hypothetical protein